MFVAPQRHVIGRHGRSCHRLCSSGNLFNCFVRIAAFLLSILSLLLLLLFRDWWLGRLQLHCWLLRLRHAAPRNDGGRRHVHCRSSLQNYVARSWLPLKELQVIVIKFIIVILSTREQGAMSITEYKPLLCLWLGLLLRNFLHYTSFQSTFVSAASLAL